MSAQGTGEALVSTVGRLWPGSEPARVSSRRVPRRREADTFLVVPSLQRPRLLVPAGDPRAAAAAMRRFSTGLSTRDLVQRLGASAALRVAGPAVFADRISIPRSEHSLVAHLSDLLGEPVRVSLGIGPARVNRKPVLEVFGPGGRSLAYVKVGDGPVAERDVRGEAAALAEIDGRLGPGIEVPRLLHTGTWDGLFFLAMSSLRTSMRQPRRGEWQVPVEPMERFATAFSQPAAPLIELPLWERMSTIAAALSAAELRERAQQALARLADRAGDRLLPVGAWHGDWTPWNMARGRHGIQLWDWERFETGVPVGLDALHYGVNTATRAHGETSAAVREGLALGGGGQDRLLAAIYLAAISCRYLASVDTERGELVLPRSELMLSSLEEWLESPAV